MHTHLTAPAARDLAGKVCCDRVGDARCCPYDGQASQRTWSGPGDLGHFATCTAYAMVSSGHLPLMMPMLLLAGLAEGQEQVK